MLPSTVDRVPMNTADSVNEEIRRQTMQNVACYQGANAQQLQARLDELDEKWDVERMLEANAATAVLVGLALGTIVDKRWFIFPGIVAGFLLQHALQGWCPPLPVFRRMGVRTASEIDYERYALKVLRGDFANVGQTQKSKNALQDTLRAAEE